MDYELNIKYPLSELDNIIKWRNQSHQMYGIFLYRDGVSIVTRDPEEYDSDRIEELKAKLTETDYIASKLAEAEAEFILTEDSSWLEQLHTKYAEILAQRKAWRKEINNIENK